MPAPRPKPQRLSVDQAFGQVLRDRRKHLALSQEQLGHLTESGRTFISELERGHKGASLKTLFRVATHLDTEPAELVRLMQISMGESIRADRKA